MKNNPLKNIKPKAKKKGTKGGKSKPVRSSEVELSNKAKRWIIILLWVGGMMPLVFVYGMIFITSEESLPSIEQLENPRSDEASLVFSADGEIIGSFYFANRTKVDFDELSPHLVDALVSTEDERYFEHSGIDGEAWKRSVYSALIT